jgi:tRNA (guanine37-N1)-methyltransferase
MRFDVLTLFPGIFAGYVGQSLLKKAIDRGLLQVNLHDLRNWSRDKHRKVDDRPYGGGPGMVLRVEPVVEAVESIQRLAEPVGHVVLLAPQGRRFNQQVAEEYSQYQRLLLVCGRYEGFDQRVIDIVHPDELSVGDYVLNGGEVAAMMVIDAVLRLVPDVLGDETSPQQDSFSGSQRLLEGAQYTRPREYRGHSVPEVLLSGDHQQIARWRLEQGYLKTRQCRSDLLPGGRRTGPAGWSEPVNSPESSGNPSNQSTNLQPPHAEEARAEEDR